MAIAVAGVGLPYAVAVGGPLLWRGWFGRLVTLRGAEHVGRDAVVATATLAAYGVGAAMCVQWLRRACRRREANSLRNPFAVAYAARVHLVLVFLAWFACYVWWGGAL